MVELDHTKVLILREYDVKKTTLTKIRYGVMTVYDIEVDQDLYADKYTKRQIEWCKEQGYPVLLNVNGTTRLLIFNRKI